MFEQDEQKHLYLDDTYLVRAVSAIVRAGLRDGQQWVVLQDNIFHPQGGGQPADRGWVAGVEVKPVHMIDNGTWIAVEAAEGLVLTAELGVLVETAIDEDTRLLHAALHTAGHLVDAATRRRGFVHIVSNHFPSQARIEFEESGSPIGEEFISGIQAEVDAAIADDLAVTSETSPDGRRVIRIGDFSVDECGGTHVAHLSELEGVVVRSAKVKKGRLKVGYQAFHQMSGDG